MAKRNNATLPAPKPTPEDENIPEDIPEENKDEPEVQEEKPVDVTNIADLKEKVSDVKVFGNPDTFKLLCKASSKQQGWMKSTKVCNVRGGCVMQTETQIKNPDGSYSLSQALTYVPNIQIKDGAIPKLGPATIQ